MNYGSRRQLLGLFGVILIHGFIAIERTAKGDRRLRARVRDVVELSPVTEPQARLALIDWPMYKALAFALIVTTMLLLTMNRNSAIDPHSIHAEDREVLAAALLALSVLSAIWLIYRLGQLVTGGRYLHAIRLATLPAAFAVMVLSAHKHFEEEAIVGLLVSILLAALIHTAAVIPFMRIGRDSEGLHETR